ncbi:TIGR03085 family metal-binding protein [Corynebacterium sp. UMB6689]|nr:MULTISPECIES: TIGR03085 family metal-binding protein [unclassified Corynebacterium]MDK6812938.1 TIGR03085 family metal-binding protein [Corynebacterium sp. UMB6689]OFS37801.1 TIGR03085 family protein [Corynebacterium sp. HMSC069E04]
MLGRMSFSSSERAKMVALFHELGPDAPTLCVGWSAHDLITHLWVRENRPDAAIGAFIPALSSHADDIARKIRAQKAYEELVDSWGRGAGRLNPLRYADSVFNAAEHFVHHEDLRRANGHTEPRDLSRAAHAELRAPLKLLGTRLLSRSRRPVVLEPQGFPPIVAADKRHVSEQGDAVVRVRGTVAELLLWAFGREAARVEIEGDTSAIVRSSL